MPLRDAPQPPSVDGRYAALVRRLEDDFAAVLDKMKPSLSAEQRAVALDRWQEIARPPLLQHLHALVGPVRPVIAEGCGAFNEIGLSGEQPEDYAVCKGETVAVVTRLGRPEFPGEILAHYPGCEKHSRMALAHLTAAETHRWFISEYKRIFHSIIALEDTRREIRQQETVDVPRPRRWFRR